MTYPKRAHSSSCLSPLLSSLAIPTHLFPFQLNTPYGRKNTAFPSIVPVIIHIIFHIIFLAKFPVKFLAKISAEFLTKFLTKFLGRGLGRSLGKGLGKALGETLGKTLKKDLGKTLGKALVYIIPIAMISLPGVAKARIRPTTREALVSPGISSPHKSSLSKTYSGKTPLSKTHLGKAHLSNADRTSPKTNTLPVSLKASSQAKRKGKARNPLQVASLPPKPPPKTGIKTTLSRADFPHQASFKVSASTHHPAPSPTAPPPTVSETVVIKAQRKPQPSLLHPQGQTHYNVTEETYNLTPALTVADMLITVPGFSYRTGNGPRDTSLSLRGSNSQRSYGISNIVLFDDGFPVTQPDGTSRADLIDPHAYESVDVFQGPSSTVFGNYALYGAINFHTHRGKEIDGLQVGSDFGSYATFNNYATFGKAGENYDISLFGSDVRGTGLTANSAYETSTLNSLMTFTLSPQDKLIFKAINNITKTLQPLRLTFDQYHQNPFQKNCLTLQGAGCASVSLYDNGAYGSSHTMSAELAGLGRFDRRTIIGVRWEHNFTSQTLWRNQFTYDERHISQPTTALSYRGPYNSYNYMSDLTRIDNIAGYNITTFTGANFNYLDYGSKVYNVSPAGQASVGALAQTNYGNQWNAGARLEETLQINKQWQVVVGVGGEHTGTQALQTIYNYTPAGILSPTYVPVQRDFTNIAPEAAVTYHPMADLALLGRVAMGYNTPSTSALFVRPDGLFGNNTDLKGEKSLGLDIGEDWHYGQILHLQTTGFYEFHTNELITQYSSNNANAYSFNVPNSQHRGIEFLTELTPLPEQLPSMKLSVNYTYDDQIFTNFHETLTNAAQQLMLNRAGRRIPGVIPHFLDARFIYEQKEGPLQGLGGFIELNWRSAFPLDNANLISADGYRLVNLNLHYTVPTAAAFFKKITLFLNIQNLLDTTYIASANNIRNTLASNGLESPASVLASSRPSIFAGTRRSFYGGIKLNF
ncbi:TonB-dependent receptor family protein [Entomobacter blattae]|uniref:Vitamin B12 transporter BtuB n=1 Tax=Entomobacter blattae TaxID=2762277 RepID=A0A7H1NQT5_9PROT|nr:TonB-dependent receptor [Entomobacter blattae]QNT78145.1 Vitamin B12 transporter BtuB [Entomobacter blattae]